MTVKPTLPRPKVAKWVKAPGGARVLCFNAPPQLMAPARAKHLMTRAARWLRGPRGRQMAPAHIKDGIDLLRQVGRA